MELQPTKHAAPGQYLGFSLQQVRLCYHLLTCPKGSSVSIELIDDVAVHNAHSTLLSEQTKSALRTNPLTDWSEELWKSLANWLVAMSENQVSKNSAFNLYAATTKIPGEFAKALSAAATPKEVEDFVQNVKSKLAKKKSPPECNKYTQIFLNAPDDHRQALVLGLKITVDADPLLPLQKLLEPAVLPQIIELICQATIGIAKEQADKLIREGKPPLLNADIFKEQFRNFVSKHNLPNYLPTMGGLDDKQVLSVLNSRPNFVRQLELIDTQTADHIRAVSDFLRTSADKSLWAEKGLIFEQSLFEWDTNLLRKFAFVSGEVEDVHSDKDEKARGRITYRRCSQDNTASLDGREVPGHFVHGSFNALADKLQLGWHRDYKSLLSDDKE